MDVRPSASSEARDSTPVTALEEPQWRLTPSALIAFVLVAYALSSRPLYTALDDAGYIEYFSNNSFWLSATGNEDWYWWRWIIEEPLWNIYCAWLGEMLGPEAAFRTTIFLSVFMYLFFASKLSGGNWAITFLLFVFHPHLATQMYHNQVRQGVALSVFVALASTLSLNSWKKMGVASGVAALVHSSFLLVFVAIASYIVKPSLRIPAALAAISILIIISQSVDLSSVIDMGRRRDVYLQQSLLNVNFYIVSITLYSFVFYLLSPDSYKSQSYDWYLLSVNIAIIAIGVGAIHEAASRMIYIAEAATCILVARNIQSPRGAIALLIWATGVAVNIISDYQYDASAQLRLFDKWQQIILGSN
jgi:EpsG family